MEASSPRKNATIPASLTRYGRCLGTIEPPAPPPRLSDGDILQRLLDPVWPDGRRTTVFDRVRPGERICLVISDQTRQSAVDRVLPVLLNGLAARGCSLADMFILVASGIHRHPTPDEIRRILGPGASPALTGRVHLHNPDDPDCLADVGVTRRGHRVRVNRLAIEADCLVLLGAATYHYHAGFGGGRKSLVPGLASRDTIAHNHSLSLDPVEDRFHPGVDLGRLDGNPVAEEMLEAARLCEPDFAINTVLTPAGELVGLFSGDLDASHRAACRMVERVCRVDLPCPADLVLASAGSAPNWIQSHKALVHAGRAVAADAGMVILRAPCPEGIGEESFRRWIRRPDVASMMRELRAAPDVLGQTALSTRRRAPRTILITALSEADARDLGMRTARDEEEAVQLVMQDRASSQGAAPGAPMTYYVMPEARHTVPFIARSECRGG